MSIEKTALKFAKDSIELEDFLKIIGNLKKEKVRLKATLNDLKLTETGFDEYCEYGINLLSGLRECYSNASLSNKQRIAGLIFPKKFAFSENNIQTTK